jgi:hypothetical protein
MRRTRLVLIGLGMFALGALVAGAAVIVYAKRGADIAEIPGALTSTRAEAKEAGKAPHGAPEILYDLSALPEPVQRMLREIIEAAASGNIEAMRPVFESNELKPMITTAYVDDPVGFWKKGSADGEGRDVLAAMLNVLSVGFVKVADGQDGMYVWPYFAAIDLSKLTPEQEVELYRLVPPSEGVPMKKAGHYGWYRLGISPSGVWHYFMK